MDFPGLHFRLPVQDFSNTNSSMPKHVDLRERGYLTFLCTDQNSDRAQKEGQKAGGYFRMPRVLSLQVLCWGRPGLEVNDVQSQAYLMFGNEPTQLLPVQASAAPGLWVSPSGSKSLGRTEGGQT